MKREYEIAVVLRTDPDEAVINAGIDQIKGWIEADGHGEVTNIDRWGRRKLAYEINKQREGYYAFVHANVEPATLPELERNLNLAADLLRYLVIRKDE